MQNQKSVSKITIIILIVYNFATALAHPEYTAAEKSCLVKFRKLVSDVTYKDYMLSDPYLIRWLRAKKMNLDEASKMLRTAIKWRRVNKIDGILNEIVLDFQYPPFYSDGIDYEGSTVVTGHTSRLDLKTLLFNNKRPELIRYYSQILEGIEIGSLEAMGVIGNASASELSRRPRADLVTLLVDLGGFMQQEHGCLRCVGVYIDWIKMLQNYYPGYYKHMIAINAPKVSSPVVKVLRPLLSPPLQRILEVYGSNQDEWLPILNKIIPPDQLRSNFGGTKSD